MKSHLVVLSAGVSVLLVALPIAFAQQGPMGPGSQGPGQPMGGSPMGGGQPMGGGPMGGGMMGPGQPMGPSMMGPGQPMGPSMMGPGQPMGSMMGRGPMGPGGRQDAASERPLISIMLQLRQQLGLSDEQVGKLTGLRSAFEKEAIRAEAELRVADLELGELLDQTNVDLAKAEAAIRKEESIRTTLRVSRIKTIEAGKALLTGEQREKLKKALEASPGMGPGQPMGGSPIGSQMMGPGGQGGGMMMGPQMMQQMMGGGMGQQAAAGPSPSPAPPGSSERVDTTGPVTVKATLLAPGTAGDSIRIQIVLDTHSVGLDGYRFEEIVRLRDGRGGEVAPAAVEGAKGSGHHREATIRFAWPQPKPKNLELVVKGVAGVPERLFRWSLQ